MNELIDLRGWVESLCAPQPGCRMYDFKPVCGPGGAWIPYLQFVGFGRIESGIRHAGGGKPVAIDVIWSDAHTALGAAQRLARLAAEAPA